jgi:uncharacterized membrane protein
LTPIEKAVVERWRSVERWRRAVVMDVVVVAVMLLRLAFFLWSPPRKRQGREM